MKIALVVLENKEQIVLTPETDLEKTLLAKMDNRGITIKRGSFYHCQGGWYRQGPSDNSTIIVLEREEQSE